MASDRSAPGELALVEEFINRMRATTGAELASWLSAHGLIDRQPADLSERDVKRALELREALRGLAVCNSGGAVDETALKPLDDAIARGAIRVSVSSAGALQFRLEATAPADRALGRLTVIALEAITDGRWRRMKVCANPECRWAYYDRSRNHSAVWCEMSSCGSVAKMRRYRERKKKGSAL